MALVKSASKSDRGQARRHPEKGQETQPPHPDSGCWLPRGAQRTPGGASSFLSDR